MGNRKLIEIFRIIEKIHPAKVLGKLDVGGLVKPVEASSTSDASSNLMWVGKKRVHLLAEIQNGVIICESPPPKVLQNCLYLVVENSRRAFMEVLNAFFCDKKRTGIANSSCISPSAKIGEGVFIGENVVIEASVIIGDNTEIDHNSVVKRDTVMAANCKVGSNCVIGGVGFGYEKDEDGNNVLIPHLGNVVLSDGVEVGNNSNIDRAVLGSTMIGKNVKIDNLVHIAHGVNVGANSLIIANSMVAGSVDIGENVWLAPSSSVLNGKLIGSNAVIGLGAVVLKNVDADSVVVGNPARKIDKK